jgi:hypothetical protein
MRETYTYWFTGRLYILLLALAVLLGCAVRGDVHPTKSTPYTPHTTGYDVSWPNCTVQPPADNAWGVVGVTGGLVFSKNPCLRQQATWFRTTSLYINTGYPGIERAQRYASAPHRCASDDESCLAYNYGYASGQYAVKTAFAEGLYSPVWWLDVETENSWSDSVDINRQALRGTADAVRRATAARIGYYSYPGQWDRITGAWRPGALAWAATGTDERQAAIAACTEPSFTGGPVLLTQYVLALDRNYACPQAR